MKCTHCNNEAEVKSYREVDGVTGTDITCRRCMFTSNDIVLLTRSKFKEGDEYWSIDHMRDEHIVLLNSCWDDISEEIDDHERFTSLDDAKKWVKAMIGASHVLISDYRKPNNIIQEIT